MKVSMNRGDLSVFNAGAANMHYVTPVTRGRRFVLLMWARQAKHIIDNRLQRAIQVVSLQHFQRFLPELEQMFAKQCPSLNHFADVDDYTYNFCLCVRNVSRILFEWLGISRIQVRRLRQKCNDIVSSGL